MVEDDHTIDLSQLVGTWEMTRMYDGEDGTWDNEYCAEYGFVATTEFREDGTCVFSCQANGNPPSLIYATYVVEANTIVIATATSAQPVVWRIEKLAASELNVAFDYPGENYTDRACYRWINRSLTLIPDAGPSQRLRFFMRVVRILSLPAQWPFIFRSAAFTGWGGGLLQPAYPWQKTPPVGRNLFPCPAVANSAVSRLKKETVDQLHGLRMCRVISPSGVHD